jgi:hypothetical protein
LQRRAVAPDEAAWLAVVPCALLTLAAIVFVAPALGDAMFPPTEYDFWPDIQWLVRHEPTEHAAFLLALVGAVTPSAAVMATRRWPLTTGPAMRHAGVTIAQATVCAFLGVSLIAQHAFVFGRDYTLGASRHYVYFTWTTVAVALLLTIGVAHLLARPIPRQRLARLTGETRGRRIGSLLVAALFTAAWLLTAVNVDSSVGHVNRAVFDMLPWSMDETWAILDGRTPLVDFHAQYGQLWPYMTAGVMALVGASLGVYTATMATIGGAALLAVFATFRRVTRSSIAALALFLPFVASGFFVQRGPLANRYGASNLFTIFPVRYAGPYLLAWLLSRALDGRMRRQIWLLTLFAGLVAINNPEFGLPALGATFAGCLLARPPRSARAAMALAAHFAAGLVGALALVAVVTLLRTGSLPNYELLFEFSRLLGVSGWGMLPMPRLGFHLVVFATFIAALTLATVRAASHEDDVVTTGLLGWSGTFGLGVGTYYVGRSHPEALISLFSAWTFALALLAVVTVRAIASRPSGRPQLAELAVLFAMGIAACSIAQTPTPWSQLDRIGNDTSVPAFRDNTRTRFIAQHTKPGESVAILTPAGHRIAYDLRLVNVSPYASIESIVTRHQLMATLATLRAAGGRKVFVWDNDTKLSVADALLAAGFTARGAEPTSGTTLLVARTR